MTDTYQERINSSNRMDERIREHDVALVRVSDAVKSLIKEHRTSAERTTAAIQDINCTLQTVGEHLTIGRLKDTEFLGALASIQETNTQLRSDLLFERDNRKQCKDDVMKTINQLRHDVDERVDIRHADVMQEISQIKANNTWLYRGVVAGLTVLSLSLIIFIYTNDNKNTLKAIHDVSESPSLILRKES